jgi:hypothetical protein
VKRITTAAAAAALLCAVAASAQTSATAGFAPPPPGSVVQNQTVAFNGENAKNAWHAVISKRLVCYGTGTNFFQWYISI